MSGYYLLAAAAGESSGMIAETARTFGVNWQLFISQTISFCIVAFLLQRFAYKPILRVLEERRQRIAEGLANAEEIKAELAKTEQARKQVIDNANDQATKLIEEARAAAARLLEQESQKAIATAEQIIAKAREAAEADHARMLAELRHEVGQLVVQTTAKVTGKLLTVDDQRRLIEDTNKELAA
jgi:F-type H+-transporting ATPase subunit b